MPDILKKSLKKFIKAVSFRIIIVPVVFVIAILCAAASITTPNTFIIHEGNHAWVHKTQTRKTADVLNEIGLRIGEDKYTEMPLEAIDGYADIYIVKKDVAIIKDGVKSSISIYAEKDMIVSDLLSANEITLGAEDIISPALETDITDGLEITITRITHTTAEEQKEIPFTTEKKANASMYKGVNKTIQTGVPGSRKIVYDVKLVNGQEESRTVISDTIEKEPVTQIIEYGTKPKEISGTLTTRSGQKLKYKNKLSMTATAYTTERTSDKVTATGKIASVGLVAVDPRIIPLGTRLYIEAANGKSWCYGIAVAADTGVRGNKVDLFFNTYKECISFGRKKATVYILE